jgi:hypothetical protein
MGDDRLKRPRSGHTTGSSVLTPPTGVPTVPDATEAPAGACLCGHEQRAHEHWRPGSECGVCGPRGCPSYRERGGRARGLLRKLRLVR